MVFDPIDMFDQEAKIGGLVAIEIRVRHGGVAVAIVVIPLEKPQRDERV